MRVFIVKKAFLGRGDFLVKSKGGGANDQMTVKVEEVARMHFPVI